MRAISTLLSKTLDYSPRMHLRRTSYTVISLAFAFSSTFGSLLALPTVAAAETMTPQKVMPLGDSTTDGYGVPGGYRNRLWQRIVNEDAKQIDFVGSLSNGPSTLPDKNHEGHTGWRIDQLRANIDSWMSSYQPDVVLLMIGSNDINQNYDTANAPARLNDLVNRICSLRAGAAVLVANSPPETGFEAQLNEFNSKVPGIVANAQSTGCNAKFVDVASVITTADYGSDWHPTSAGYDKIADAWYPVLSPLIKASTTTDTPGPVSSTPTLTATVDERVTTGTNRFGYTGTWVDCGGCNAGAYMNSFKYAYTTGNSVTFTFTGSQAKFFGYKEPAGGIASMSIDGVQSAEIDLYAPATTLTTTATTPLLAEGTHTVTFSVTGRKNSASVSPTITMDKAEVYSGGTSTNTPPADTIAPAVAITSPTNGSTATVGSTVSFTVSVSDNVGVTKVEYFNGPALIGTSTNAPYSVAWNTSGQSAGTKTLTAKAYDAAGNVNTSSSINLNLQTPADTAAPLISLTSPLNGSSVTIGGTVGLTVTASDNVAVTKVEYFSNGSLIGTTSTNPFSFNWNTSGQTAGTKTLTAKAYDAAGNSTVSAPISVNLTSSQSTPTQSLVATVDDKVVSGTHKFAYTGTWTDCGGCNTGAYMNSFKYAKTAGNKFVFTFTGTQVKLYGYKEPQGGIASVSIDGGTAVDVDQYASSRSLSAVYSSAVLAKGIHTVTFTVTGRKASASISPTVNIDRAEVYSN